MSEKFSPHTNDLDPVPGQPRVSIDETGAYVREFVDTRGNPLLFTKADIDGKTRGGSHVCLPAFGPDASGTLPQHGYGREVEWDIVTSHDGLTTQCEHRQSEGPYAGLQSRLIYQLVPGDDGSVFQTKLFLFNHSDKAMPISPGFHPYFAVDPSDIRLNGEHISLADFEPFQDYGTHESMTLETAGRTVTISSPDLQHFIVWSDSRGDYLCIEPTLAGSGFDYNNPREGELLPAQKSKSFSYTVQW